MNYDARGSVHRELYRAVEWGITGRSTINYVTHNLRLALLSPLIGAYLVQRYLSGKSRPGWRERWGDLPEPLIASESSRPRVWVHAVSAGEVVAAVPILRELRQLLPDHDILLSVITPMGHEMAEQQATPFIDGLFYFPFDVPWVVRKIVKSVRPQVFVTLESDMWPNLLYELKRSGCHTVMVNGRISEASYGRSRKFARGLYRWMLSNMDLLLMQSAMDAQRVRDLGQFDEAGRVAVLGNSKFDQEITRLNPEQVLALRHELRLPDTAPVFVAGSTRSSEEEQEVIAAYLKMCEEFPDLCLVVAPRYIERAPDLEAAMRQVGLTPIRRSAINRDPGSLEGSGNGAYGTVMERVLPSTESEPETGRVAIILDTMGELAKVYAVASVAFVGNSFPPVNKGGGQNLLQPLAHGKPVLFGPCTATIRAEVALAREAGVGFCVLDREELAAKALELLRSHSLREEILVHAVDIIAANRGVSLRYAELVAGLASEAR